MNSKRTGGPIDPSDHGAQLAIDNFGYSATERFNDDTRLVRYIERHYSLQCRGQLVSTNVDALEHPARNNHLYKCPECPTLDRTDPSAPPQTHRCISSATCCETYWLVFQSIADSCSEACGSRCGHGCRGSGEAVGGQQIVKEQRGCCTGVAKTCRDISQWFAVDPYLNACDFDPQQHLVPIHAEHSVNIADQLAHRCQECQCDPHKYGAAAQWRSCSTCRPCDGRAGVAKTTDRLGRAGASGIDTDLVRDSLVRVGEGNKFYQYKPLARTDASRVHGTFGQSVFRGHGPKHYLPDHRRRLVPLRGGYVPQFAPRAVSAVYAPKLCDDATCRSALY